MSASSVRERSVLHEQCPAPCCVISRTDQLTFPRTSMISATKLSVGRHVITARDRSMTKRPSLNPQKTQDSSVKTTMPSSKVHLSSYSARKTSHSPTYPDTCEPWPLPRFPLPSADSTIHQPSQPKQPKGLTRSSHILFELLKNSLRAVVERNGVDNEDSFPPIKVVVVEGSEDITIKISDEGGGIPRSAIPLIWTYLYTTMSDEGLEANIDQSDFKAPMAGFGYGLPLSRLVCSFSLLDLGKGYHVDEEDRRWMTRAD